MIAVGACLTIGLPVASVSLVWNVSAGGVHEVVGRLEFSRQNTPEELEEGFRMWGMVDHRQWATQTPEEAP